MRSFLFMLLLIVGQAAGAQQIDISVPNEPIEAGRHYLLRVTGLHAADLPNTALMAEPKNSASVISESRWAGEHFVWFSASEDGRHFVSVVTVRNGKPVTASAIIEVGKGPDPVPPPPPPPPPPDEDLWGAVIVEETHGRASSLAAILTSRAMASFLETSGLTLRPFDLDVLDESGEVADGAKPYFDKAAGSELPLLFVVGKNGHVFYEGKVPATPAGLIELLKQYDKEDSP